MPVHPCERICQRSAGQVKKMKYVDVDGLSCSRIGMGTIKFGTEISGGLLDEMMSCYMELGGNVLDTAEVYSDWLLPDVEKSISEKAIGRWIENHPEVRKKLVLCTKGGHYRFLDPDRRSRVRPECIRQDLACSLENLHTDRIDLYWLHRDDPSYPVEPIMDELFSAQDQGLIKAIGASNWTDERIAAANEYAKKCGRKGFCATQVRYPYVTPLPYKEEGEIRDTTTLSFAEETGTDFCLAQHMAVFAFCAQAKGYITKVLKGTPLPEMVALMYDSPKNRKKALRAGKVAEELEVSPEAVGLSYLFSRRVPVCALAGPGNMEQLKSTMEAADLSLTQSQIEYLEGED